MHELSRKFYFDAAHSLECEVDAEANRRMHGHSYRVDVAVRGTPDKKSGMLIDLGTLDKVLEETRQALDHRLLNDVKDLGPATLENLSSWIWRRLAPKIPNLAKVTVSREHRGDACAYTGPGQKTA